MQFPDRVRTCATITGFNPDNDAPVTLEPGFVLDVVDVVPADPAAGIYLTIVTVVDPGDLSQRVVFDILFFDYEEDGGTVRGNVETVE